MNEKAMTQSETRVLATVSPMVDVLENGEGMVLIADLPGVNPDSLALNYENGTLSLRGERPWGNGEKRGVVEYVRRFVVPRGVDASRIEATTERGVLKVTLPKSEALKARRIPITVG